MNEARQQLLAAAADAASSPAPALKMSAVGTVLVGLGDWLSTGPGLATAVGLLMTAASLIVQVWSTIRRDRRESREHEARIRGAERPQ